MIARNKGLSKKNREKNVIFPCLCNVINFGKVKRGNIPLIYNDFVSMITPIGTFKAHFCR